MSDTDQDLEDGRDNGSSEAKERVEREHPRDQRSGKDTRSQIRDAIREHKDKSYDDEGNPVKGKDREPKPDASARDREQNGRYSPGDKAGKEGTEAEAKKKAEPAPSENLSTTKDVNEEAKQTPSQAAKSAIAPPDALSREIRSMWEQIPEAVQKEFVRREEDVKRGVDQLKARYKAYDDAFTPVRDELSALGKTEAEGMQMLVNWRMALRGPNKVQAFRALAQAEGIDLANLVGPAPARQTTNGQPQPNMGFDPNALRPVLDPVLQKVTTLEQVIQRQNQERVQADIAEMSRDKPHFEKVRALMGHLINSGEATGNNPKEVFDRAYDMACNANFEVRALMQQEAEAKREAELKAKAEADAKAAADAEAERKRKEREALEKAKKASVGPRGSSPVGAANIRPRQGEKPGDTLRRVISEARGAV